MVYQLYFFVKIIFLESSPKHIKLYTNKKNINFDDIEKLISIQEAELSKEPIQNILLKIVKFQNIHHLTV